MHLPKLPKLSGVFALVSVLVAVALALGVASTAASPPSKDGENSNLVVTEELVDATTVNTVVVAEVAIAKTSRVKMRFSCPEGHATQGVESFVLESIKTDPRAPYQLTPFYDRAFVRWSMHGPVSHDTVSSYSWELARLEVRAMRNDAFSRIFQHLLRGCTASNPVPETTVRTKRFVSTMFVDHNTRTATISPDEDSPIYYGDSQVIVEGYADSVSALWYIWHHAPDQRSRELLLDGFASTVSQEDANDRAYCTAVAIVQHDRGADAITPAMLEKCADDLVHDAIGFWLTVPIPQEMEPIPEYTLPAVVH